MLEESINSSSGLQETFIEAKCMLRGMHVVITRRRSGRRSPSDVGMITQISVLQVGQMWDLSDSSIFP